MEKVRLIQRSPDRAEEISKTFEEWGGENKNGLSFEEEVSYYYLDQFGFCRCINENIARKLISEGKAEIYELPQPKHVFKPFEKVLVIEGKTGEWVCDLFSHYCYGGGYYCISHKWRNQCIPYEGNEYLLGTTDKPNQ